MQNVIRERGEGPLFDESVWVSAEGGPLEARVVGNLRRASLIAGGKVLDKGPIRMVSTKMEGGKRGRATIFKGKKQRVILTEVPLSAGS